MCLMPTDKSRRRFLKAAGATVLATGLGVDLPWRHRQALAAERKSRIAVVQDMRLAEAEGDKRQRKLSAMVHLAVREAVGALTPREAYQALFTATDVVAIKVNCSDPHFATDPQVVRALIEGLHIAQVPDENIIIYDRDDKALAAAGYQLNAQNGGPRCFGTLGTVAGCGYEDDVSTVGKTSFHLSKIVAEMATAIINVPVVKDNAYAGVSVALKNHFGSIDNPQDFHYSGCNPAIADVNAAPEIRTKQRLVVVDALRVLYEGGPTYQEEFAVGYHTICASTDAVAVDVKCAQLVDLMRQRHGLDVLARVGREPKYIATAGKPEYHLGISDDKNIEMIVHKLHEQR